MRRADHLPIYRNEIQQALTKLNINYASSTYTCIGGYIPAASVLNDLLMEYVESNALHLHPLKPSTRFWIKLAIDNTKLLYAKTEGYYLSLLDVEKCQSPKHQIPLALTRTVDTNSEMRRVVTETDMTTLVDAVSKYSIIVDDITSKLDLFLTLDWMGLVHELDMKDPKHARDNEVGCPFCGELLGVFRHTWWETPFKRYTTTQHISDFTGSLFYNLPLTNRRYCFMYGSNALLSNACKDVFTLFHANSPLKSQYQNLLRTVSPKWNPKKFFQPNEIKAFFKKKLQEQVVGIFMQVQGTYYLPTPDNTTVPYPVWKVVALLFDSCRVYQEFGYTEWPTVTDFGVIERARVGLLAVYAGMKWRMKPTIHHMTNEALEFAHEDGTVYHTLNEAVENFHKEMKEGASNTMKNITEYQTHDNSYQHIINRVSTKKALRKLGYGPVDYQLIPPDYSSVPPPINISLLQFSSPLLVDNNNEN